MKHRRPQFALTLTCCVTLAGAAGCRGSSLVALSPDDFHSAGTARFEAPRAQVYASCEAALRAMGYQVDERDEVRGLLRTTLLQARTAPVAREGVFYLRRFEVRVSSAGVEAATVIATPVLLRSFRTRRGITEPVLVGAATVWTPQEERAEWRRFFQEAQAHIEKPSLRR